MKRAHLWLLMLALLLVLSIVEGLAACAPDATPVLPPSPTPLPTAVVPEKPIYTVRRGEVVAGLTFTGRVSPAREAELYFRSDGRVLKVYVTRGDAVQAGDLLAELDATALHRQLAQAELALETARADLERAKAERTYTLARAQLNLALEQIALNKLKDYDPDVDLAAAKAELDQATVALQQAQANYDAVAHYPDIAMRPEAQALQQATLAYALAKAAYDQAAQQSAQRAYDIQSQQKRVELARLEVEHLEAGVDPRLEQAVAKAELDLADLQAQIADTLILAPFDGKVMAVSTAVGKAVEAYQPVLIVADPTELEVTADLSAEEMRRLSEGQAVTAIPIEYPGQALPGVIRSLPYPYSSGGSAGDLKEEDRTTHLDVNFGDLAVEPGDLVRVTVILERKEDVLWLPPAAIRTFEGRKFVVVQEGSRQRRVDITLGIESAERVEIVAGLEEGDVVIGY